MGQFVANAVALGNEIWAYPGHGHPSAHTIPMSRLEHWRIMRRMDALYLRLEGGFRQICTWSLPPRRLFYGFPLVVWEFNTTLDYGRFAGQSEQAVKQSIDLYKYYARGCDLAICMTQGLADHVRDTLGIQRFLIVPNGSDPELFHPDVSIAPRLTSFQQGFNLVWIGTAKERWHDFNMLAEAAKLVWSTASQQHIAFHIIGSDLSGVMANMPPNVYYWGAEYYEKLPRWLSGMDVGLNLYRPGPADIATPLKVFDYMASGLTVVSTAQPFMRDLFETLGQGDLLIPSGDAKRLAEVVIRLASNRERVRHLGQRGRQLVIDYYNWQRAAGNTMEEIQILLRERGKERRA